MSWVDKGDELGYIRKVKLLAASNAVEFSHIILEKLVEGRAEYHVYKVAQGYFLT